MQPKNPTQYLENLAVKYRKKKKSSPKAIFRRFRREQSWLELYGDYILAKAILRGCLSCGRVSRHEYEGLVSELPPRSEDDTRSAISQEFRHLID